MVKSRRKSKVKSRPAKNKCKSRVVLLTFLLFWLRINSNSIALYFEPKSQLTQNLSLFEFIAFLQVLIAAKKRFSVCVCVSVLRLLCLFCAEPKSKQRRREDASLNASQFGGLQSRRKRTLIAARLIELLRETQLTSKRRLRNTRLNCALAVRVSRFAQRVACANCEIKSRLKHTQFAACNFGLRMQVAHRQTIAQQTRRANKTR